MRMENWGGGSHKGPAWERKARMPRHAAPPPWHPGHTLMEHTALRRSDELDKHLVALAPLR